MARTSNLGAHTQLIKQIDQQWISGLHVKRPHPRARKWMSFFACMHATCLLLQDTLLDGRFDLLTMWDTYLKQECFNLYQHNVTQFQPQPLSERLAGLAADLSGLQIDKRGAGPVFPVGETISRGAMPSTQLEMRGTRTLWTVRQTTLENHLKRYVSSFGYTISDLVSEAKETGALSAPNSHANTSMLTLGAGTPAPCYQFFID
jgi:hypothetical protein